jgi:hypothetical protein
LRLLTNIFPDKKQNKLIKVGVPLLEEQLNFVSVIEQIRFLQKVSPVYIPSITFDPHTFEVNKMTQEKVEIDLELL